MQPLELVQVEQQVFVLFFLEQAPARVARFLCMQASEEACAEEIGWKGRGFC